MATYFTLTPEPLLDMVQKTFKKQVDWERCLIFYNTVQLFSSINRFSKTQGAPISKLYLRSILGGKKADQIISKMSALGVIKTHTIERENEDTEVIEDIETYKVGSYSKAYVIQKEFYLTKNNTKYRKVCSQLNINALNRAKEKSFMNSKLKESKYSHSIKNLNSVGINIEAALEFLKNEFADISIWKYQNYYNSIKNISYENIHYSRGRNGRLTTTYTNLKREFRQFLCDKTDGSFDFNEIDISNSQPLFVSIFFEDKYPIYAKNVDFVNWKNLCMKGGLYEFISKELVMDRQYIKDRFMDVLLYTRKNKKFLLEEKNWNEENKEIHRFLNGFTKLFPTIWELLLKIKKEIQNDGFAVKIQQMEADLMIDNVLVSLNNLGTNFSIHDSIVCKTADVEIVKSRIIEAFRIKYNVSVNLKQKMISNGCNKSIYGNNPIQQFNQYPNVTDNSLETFLLQSSKVNHSENESKLLENAA
ncbi:MAG: hypothetical protein NT007_00430 [Candidatus Kapabacteria bacterium]|nr:hypothetical protein [Candidatus Kapabacteria bacterium]